jgi:hypothetical protein
MKTNLGLASQLHTSTSLLGLGEVLFRGWQSWPSFITAFLDRFPPSVSYEDWMEDSGWVVMCTDRLEILSPEVAERKRLLMEKEDSTRANMGEFASEIERALRNFPESEEGLGV